MSAVEKGNPDSPSSVPLLDLKRAWPEMREEVLAELADVFDDCDFILGKRTAALEEEIAAVCHAPHAAACNSGTDALLLGLLALGCEPGSEVVTSPFTFFATGGAAWNRGTRLVFADIEEDSFNLDPAAAAAAVTSKTRCIIPVHLFGRCADMTAIMGVAAEHGVPVLEDAAQSLGAEHRGRRAGEMGDATAISFYPSKNLGGPGDGGMFVTRDAEVDERFRQARNHGQTERYYHAFVGTNSRMDGVQAAVLRIRLKRLEAWTEARIRHAARYEEALAGVDGLRTPGPDPDGRHVFNQYTIRCDRRDDLQAHLREAGIGCAVYYPLPLHLQPCFESLGGKEGQFPVAEKACREVLSIPV
ncbi:MAG: DegT/DnrJ/EryC1/StrS family aminotransferase, partial [Planctomycetota bacterium]